MKPVTDKVIALAKQIRDLQSKQTADNVSAVTKEVRELEAEIRALVGEVQS